MYKALDLSNYDYDVYANAPALVAAGFPAFFQGAQRVLPATQIAQSMINAGSKLLAVYCYLYFGFDVTIEVQKAIDVANTFNCRWIAMDVESTAAQENGILNPALRVSALKTAVNMAVKAGFNIIIYTYGPYWINEMGNSTDFSSYPLWYANYGMNDGQLQPINTVGFGGWHNVSIHQFCSGVSISGRNRDQNYVLDESLFNDGGIDMVTAKELQDQIDALKSGEDSLNSALQKRMAIHRLADGDYELVKQAWDLLKPANLV